MKKQTLLCLILASCFSVSAFAGSAYIGPTIFVQHVSASHSHYDGIQPRLSLGYGSMLSDTYYLAGELFASPATVNLSDSHSGAVSAKISRSFGISFLPGMMFNQTLLGYLRLGWLNSKFSGPNLSRSGAQLGVGLQSALTKSWNIRGEFIYTAYQSVAGLGSPNTEQLGIGVTYNFVL